MKSPTHQEHFGIESCKKTHKAITILPLMNSEIEDFFMKCPTCLTFRNHQPSYPIINHSIPNQTWTKIDVDPLRLHGHYYILMTDYYVKFIIEILKDLQSSTVLNKCKNIFSQFGTPKYFIPESGPEFTSIFQIVFEKLGF